MVIFCSRCQDLDSGIEILEDQTLVGVGLEEGCEHQGLHSHELDQNVEGWA